MRSKKPLIKEITSIKIEAISAVMKNYNNFINTHPINEEIDSIKIMVRWVKISRVFRNNTRKSGQQDVRKCLLIS